MLWRDDDNQGRKTKCYRNACTSYKNQNKRTDTTSTLRCHFWKANKYTVSFLNLDANYQRRIRPNVCSKQRTSLLSALQYTCTVERWNLEVQVSAEMNILIFSRKLATFPCTCCVMATANLHSSRLHGHARGGTGISQVAVCESHYKHRSLNRTCATHRS
jgi:hypothetical protein